tara:strand:+ start:934 stop:1581 length:648 start_codon:yes stop_codon:yes gene_type:complete
MTGKIKLVHSGGNSVSLAVPTSNPSASEVGFKLPQSDGSANEFLKTDGSGNLSFAAVSAGITMVDSWVVTASFNSSGAADITSNWAKHSAGSSAFGTIGTGMTESSGIFTFPSTGIYMVQHTASGRCHGSARPYMGMRQFFSVDSGSSYSRSSSGYDSGHTDADHFAFQGTVIYDVTNTSTLRIKFNTEASASTTYFGNATNRNTGAIFIRLGDT